MAAFARTNPTAVALAVLQKTFQNTVFKYVLSGSDGAIALTAATATPVTDELGTTSAVFQVSASGLVIITVGDRHNLDIDTLAIRVGRIIGAGSRTASGVWTFTAGGTLTVTEPTTFASIL
jgi:hypothetical protein